MKAENNIAKAIGTLFIITMFLGMIDAYTVAPLLHTSLADYSSYATKLYIGAFSILFMSIGVVGIAILLYPILEKYNKIIAISYLSSRVMESILLIVGVIVYFILLSLGQEFINTGSPDSSYLITLANIAIETRYGSYQVAMIILSISSIMLCYLLYTTLLIPRLISVVGLIGYTLVLISAPLDILGIINTTEAGGILYIPGAIFELFLFPGWLIIKGFNPNTISKGIRQ